MKHPSLQLCEHTHAHRAWQPAMSHIHHRLDGSATPQVACYGTRTSAASEELVTACMADGRGARFSSGLTVAQGGCTEPRSAAGKTSQAWNSRISMDVHLRT